MAIGIVGIIFLSRLHEARWANQRQAGLHWKVEEPSCRKRGCPCARSRKFSDFIPWGGHSARCRQLCRRSGDGFRFPEDRRSGRAAMARHRRVERRPSDAGRRSVAGKTRPPKPVTRAGLRGNPPRTANQQARYLATPVGGVPGKELGRLLEAICELNHHLLRPDSAAPESRSSKDD